MIQHAPGPLLSEEQLRSCLIAGFEARKSGHGLVAADQCNSPKEWIKVLSAVSPQLWLLAAEDQKGQLMIDSRFSAQKQSQPIQLADYFYHLTQQVWRGAGFFWALYPSHCSQGVQEDELSSHPSLPPGHLHLCPLELQQLCLPAQAQPCLQWSELITQHLMHNESVILTHCYSLQQSCHTTWQHPSTKEKPQISVLSFS